MKNINYLLVALVAGVLALAGCGKSTEGAPPGAVIVDTTKFREAFPSPAPQIQSSLDKLKFLTSQGRNEAALYELESMSRIPGLTDAQKQAIKDLSDEVKKAIAAAPAKPAQ